MKGRFFFWKALELHSMRVTATAERSCASIAVLAKLEQTSLDGSVEAHLARASWNLKNPPGGGDPDPLVFGPFREARAHIRRVASMKTPAGLRRQLERDELKWFETKG